MRSRATAAVPNSSHGRKSSEEVLCASDPLDGGFSGPRRTLQCSLASSGRDAHVDDEHFEMSVADEVRDHRSGRHSQGSGVAFVCREDHPHGRAHVCHLRQTLLPARSTEREEAARWTSPSNLATAHVPGLGSASGAAYRNHRDSRAKMRIWRTNATQNNGTPLLWRKCAVGRGRWGDEGRDPRRGLGTRFSRGDRSAAQAHGRDRRPADPLAHHAALRPLWLREFIVCLGYKGE